MPSCRIYYWDNSVGVKVDADLIKDCLDSHFNCEIFDFSCSNDAFFNYEIKNDQIDIGIFIQNYDITLLENNNKNVLIVNEEWLSFNESRELDLFDHIIVKSKYAKNILYDIHKSIELLYFWSRDLYSDYYSNFKNKNKLHFAGKSIQKNTESLISNTDIHIFDSSGRFKDVREEKYYHNFISDNKLQRVFNTCDTHICPSLYEAHGHYMFEGMLCNKTVIASKIPVWSEQIDPSYIVFVDIDNVSVCNNEYDFLSGENNNSTTKYLWRRGFLINEDQLNSSIENSKCKKPRDYILDLFEKNKKTFLEFFKSI